MYIQLIEHTARPHVGVQKLHARNVTKIRPRSKDRTSASGARNVANIGARSKGRTSASGNCMQ